MLDRCPYCDGKSATSGFVHELDCPLNKFDFTFTYGNSSFANTQEEINKILSLENEIYRNKVENYIQELAEQDAKIEQLERELESRKESKKYAQVWKAAAKHYRSLANEYEEELSEKEEELDEKQELLVWLDAHYWKMAERSVFFEEEFFKLRRAQDDNCAEEKIQENNQENGGKEEYKESAYHAKRKSEILNGVEANLRPSPPCYITDGFGNYVPENCPICGGDIQFVRPGDARCTECEGLIIYIFEDD